MANNGEILISSKDGVYKIKVTGRATFDCAPPLRDLAKQLETAPFSAIYVGLEGCIWMDSTFMGVLAMLGLRSKKVGAVMEICSASEQNTALLTGLGLKKLFTFSTRSLDEAGDTSWQSGMKPGLKAEEGARTVLEAHQTLMGVDESNVPKFESVVNLVKQDIDKMEADGQK